MFSVKYFKINCIIAERMIIIGYIVSNVCYNAMDVDFVKVVKTIDEAKFGMPCLIIGLNEAKSYCEEHSIKFDILKSHIHDNVYWTFKKTEKGDIFSRDLSAFYEKVTDNIIDKLDYRYVNIVKLKYTSLKKLYNYFFNDSKRKIIFIDKDMVYLVSSNNIVCGLSLKILDYYLIDRKKIIDKLHTNKANYVVFSTRKDLYGIRKHFENNVYAIPYILTNFNIQT